MEGKNNMPQIDKRLWRLATAVHTALAGSQHAPRIDWPQSAWDQCAELVRQSQRAEMRGWKLAAEAFRRDLGYTIPTLQSELAALVAQLPRFKAIQTTTTVGDIYADLLALAKDFGELDFDVGGRWVGVTTEPITLAGIYLGPFEIRLDLRRIRDDYPYRVIAKDPHACESREEVTHPHVSSERLCEGDSRTAIRQAIAQGRLLDFFTLVANGLRSYNPDSPFVALELWYGSSCNDCDCLVDEDDRYVCQKCESTICSECQSCCQGCDDTCCSQCGASCEACDEVYCRDCLKPCGDCQRQICPECFHTFDVDLKQAVGKYLAGYLLHYPPAAKVNQAMLTDFENQGIGTVTVHDERCANCHENDRQEGNEETPSAPDGAEVFSRGVGQAPVPA